MPKWHFHEARLVAVVMIAMVFIGTFQSQTLATNTVNQMPMVLTSTAFNNGEKIPALYTCDGSGISPPLAWNNAPAETKSYALIMVDATVEFTHWVIFNIPASETGLVANISPVPNLSNGAIQAVNDFGDNGYGGPCPSSGTHKYVFYLYALDTQLNLGPNAARQNVLAAMNSQILAQTQLTGLYR
jgi:Raf kinase inhibitor-like YbhB/YbcL family protein